MNTTARCALLSLAILSINTSMPTMANAATHFRDACSMQHNDPLVLHRALPSGSFVAQRKAVASVTVSREGLVRHVALAHSSGDARFDAAALTAVERTAFVPAARSCVAVASTFGYELISSAGGNFATAVIPGSIDVVADRR